MTDWLSETEEEIKEYREHGHEVATWFIKDIALMARVLRELAMFYNPSPTEYEILSDDAKALIDSSRN